MANEINEEVQSSSLALQLESMKPLVESLAWQAGDMFHHDTITGNLYIFIFFINIHSILKAL